MTRPLADHLRTSRIMLANCANYDETQGHVEDAHYTRSIVEGIDTALRRAREIARHIKALDWSGTSLQHQLAMSAAVTALEGTVPDCQHDAVGPVLSNPVGEMQLLLTDLLRYDANSR